MLLIFPVCLVQAIGLVVQLNWIVIAVTVVGHRIFLNYCTPLKTNIQINADPMCSRHRHHRVIEKSGHENVSFRRIPQKSWRYVRDLVTTMVSALSRLIPKKFLTTAPSNMNDTITPASTKLCFEQSDLVSFADDDAYSYSDIKQNNKNGNFHIYK